MARSQLKILRRAPYPRNTNCTQGMGPSMLIVIAVRNVIAFCTRGMGLRTTFAKMRTQDSPLSCVQDSDARIRRPYTRLYAEHKRSLYAGRRRSMNA
jgi:hypothetical protein